MTDQQKLLQQLTALDNLKEQKKEAAKEFKADIEAVEKTIRELRISLAGSPENN